jgi:MoaA/NifB/PqqE/SkfB family radical SAM enzyme
MDLPATTPTSMLREIRVLHIEPTDVCQLACPLCARETDVQFDKNTHHHLTIDHIMTHFSESDICTLDKMFMCGNYGDPAAGLHTIEIYQHFKRINCNITLGMNTNGALRNTAWWQQLASTLSSPTDYVVFSIDGLEDTNHLYRQNCNWQKLIENAQAFINAGGSAHWDMLVYQHNQHQVELCEELARTLGFKWFRAKVSKRPFIKGLEFPVGWKKIKQHPESIDCHALREKSIYIDAQGRISPCCWLGSRQYNFVEDFDLIQHSWSTDQPNPVCASACGVQQNQLTNFEQQWQKNIKLC